MKWGECELKSSSLRAFSVKAYFQPYSNYTPLAVTVSPLKHSCLLRHTTRSFVNTLFWIHCFRCIKRLFSCCSASFWAFAVRMASHADSAHDLLDLDISTLRSFVELFPQQGLSKVLKGYLSSGISKYPLSEETPEAPDLSEGGVSLGLDVPLSQQDCLELMTVITPISMFFYCKC